VAVTRWREDVTRDNWGNYLFLRDMNTGVVESFAEIAAVHQNGVSVLVMAESPLHTEILDPKRVAALARALSR